MWTPTRNRLWYIPVLLGVMAAQTGVLSTNLPPLGTPTSVRAHTEPFSSQPSLPTCSSASLPLHVAKHRNVVTLIAHSWSGAANKLDHDLAQLLASSECDTSIKTDVTVLRLVDKDIDAVCAKYGLSPDEDLSILLLSMGENYTMVPQEYSAAAVHHMMRQLDSTGEFDIPVKALSTAEDVEKFQASQDIAVVAFNRCAQFKGLARRKALAACRAVEDEYYNAASKLTVRNLIRFASVSAPEAADFFLPEAARAEPHPVVMFRAGRLPIACSNCSTEAHFHLWIHNQAQALFTSISTLKWPGASLPLLVNTAIMQGHAVAFLLVRRFAVRPDGSTPTHVTHSLALLQAARQVAAELIAEGIGTVIESATPASVEQEAADEEEDEYEEDEYEEDGEGATTACAADTDPQNTHPLADGAAVDTDAAAGEGQQEPLPAGGAQEQEPLPAGGAQEQEPGQKMVFFAIDEGHMPGKYSAKLGLKHVPQLMIFNPKDERKYVLEVGAVNASDPAALAPVVRRFVDQYYQAHLRQWLRSGEDALLAGPPLSPLRLVRPVTAATLPDVLLGCTAPHCSSDVCNSLKQCRDAEMWGWLADGGSTAVGSSGGGAGRCGGGPSLCDSAEGSDLLLLLTREGCGACQRTRALLEGLTHLPGLAIRYIDCNANDCGPDAIYGMSNQFAFFPMLMLFPAPLPKDVASTSLQSSEAAKKTGVLQDSEEDSDESAPIRPLPVVHYGTATSKDQVEAWLIQHRTNK